MTLQSVTKCVSLENVCRKEKDAVNKHKLEGSTPREQKEETDWGRVFYFC